MNYTRELGNRYRLPPGGSAWRSGMDAARIDAIRGR